MEGSSISLAMSLQPKTLEIYRTWQTLWIHNQPYTQTDTHRSGSSTESEFRLATCVTIKCAWDQTSWGLHGQGSMQQLSYTAPNKAHHKRKASLKTKPASSLWLVIGQLQSSRKWWMWTYWKNKRQSSFHETKLCSVRGATKSWHINWWFIMTNIFGHELQVSKNIKSSKYIKLRSSTDLYSFCILVCCVRQRMQ